MKTGSFHPPQPKKWSPSVAVQKHGALGAATIQDNRPSTVYQRKLREAMDAKVGWRSQPLQQEAGDGLGDRSEGGVGLFPDHDLSHAVAHSHFQPAPQLQVSQPADDDVHWGEQTVNEGTATHAVIQRIIEVEDVKSFFRGLMLDTNATQLNLYTHVLKDGVGDASLIGHLHDKLSSLKKAFGLHQVTTYLAVEKGISENELEAYVDSNKDVGKFKKENEYIEDNQAFKHLVTGLSRAHADDVVWAATLSKKDGNRREEGRNASPIVRGHWEIQYPVPYEASESKVLSIKEMGMFDAGVGKTGEYREGIGYGIPELNGNMTPEEDEMVQEAGGYCNLSEAWLASIKGMKDIDPLPNVLDMVLTHGRDNTLIYLPGGIGRKLGDLDDYRVEKLKEKEGLILSKIESKENKVVYALSGMFRNEFLQNRMASITDGLILSGGEGLFSESLAVEGANVAPVLAARYRYQLFEIATALANNYQTERKVVKKAISKDGHHCLSSEAREIGYDYGLIKIGGSIYAYNESVKRIFNLFNDGKIKVMMVLGSSIENEAEAEDVEIEYSRELSAMYLPMSLNTKYFSHTPSRYSFQKAKETFAAERDRLKKDKNWFDIISSVSEEDFT